jgi:hypothetical protein
MQEGKFPELRSWPLDSSFKRKKTMKTKLARSLPLAVLTVAALVGAVLFATPKALSVDTVHYVGTAGPYLGSCSVAQCDTSSGCRSTAEIWDQWYPGKSCSGALVSNGGAYSCLESFRICRIILFYSDSNCTGTYLNREMTYRSMCSGGGEAPPAGGS